MIMSRNVLDDGQDIEGCKVLDQIEEFGLLAKHQNK